MPAVTEQTGRTKFGFNKSTLETIHLLYILIAAVLMGAFFVGREMLTASEAAATYQRKDLYERDRVEVRAWFEDLRSAQTATNNKLDRILERQGLKP